MGSNSRNKLHQTTYKDFYSALYNLDLLKLGLRHFGALGILDFTWDDMFGCPRAGILMRQFVVTALAHIECDRGPLSNTSMVACLKSVKTISNYAMAGNFFSMHI